MRASSSPSTPGSPAGGPVIWRRPTSPTARHVPGQPSSAIRTSAARSRRTSTPTRATPCAALDQHLRKLADVERPTVAALADVAAADPQGICHPETPGARWTRVDGSNVSNHGGRQANGGVPRHRLPTDVVAATAGDVPVLFDSGIRFRHRRPLPSGIGRPCCSAVRGHRARPLLAEADLPMAVDGYPSPDDLTSRRCAACDSERHVANHRPPSAACPRSSGRRAPSSTNCSTAPRLPPLR